MYLKSQLISQLEDARRRLEDEDRRRSLLEANLHQVIAYFSKKDQIERYYAIHYKTKKPNVF